MGIFTGLVSVTTLPRRARGSHSFPSDSEFSFKMPILDFCQLLRQLSTRLCLDCRGAA